MTVVNEKMSGFLHSHFKANLKLRRAELDLTQADLAQRLGVSQPYVAEVETGRCVPSIDVVERFAMALDTTPYRLLRDPSEKNRD